MAAMPIYGINPSKIWWTDFEETWHEASMTQVCINHDPVMTLTYFKARSTLFAYVFEWVNC